MQFDIRRFDIYRKIPKDLTQPTYTGACISMCSCLFMAFLFVSELLDFLRHDVKNEVLVHDPVSSVANIPVWIDISLEKMECKYVGLDIQDDLGRHEVGFEDNVEKTPINDGAGCRFTGRFKISKVPGNFHISTHSSQVQPPNPDMRHHINEVIFGQKVETTVNGSFNPLKDKQSLSSETRSSYEYYIKIVPTEYRNIEGMSFFPYQYTFASKIYLQYGHNHQVNPAIWFRYDTSPITTRYTVMRKPLYSFLTTVCAIVGGTFTVAGIIDSLIFTTWNIIRKADLNKLS